MITTTINNTTLNNNNNFIFDTFNDKSLKYNHYNIYSSDDIINDDNLINTSFIANPFLYILAPHNWYLFYELFNLNTNNGEIGVSMSIDNGNSWTYGGIVLSETFHLSYPNIINMKNNEYIYMIPSTSKAEDGSIRIYKSSKINFPFNWQLETKKLDSLNSKWTDTSVIYSKQRYYIFTTRLHENIDLKQGSLFIFYTDINKELTESIWHQHPFNPIYDRNRAYFRNAGNLYHHKYNNKIYRFTQESNHFNGVKVHIFLITKLNTVRYEDKYINTIEPSMIGTNVKRIHHLHVNHLYDNNTFNIIFDFDTIYGPNKTLNDKYSDIVHNEQYKEKNKRDFMKLNIDINKLKFIYKLPKLIHFIWISDNIDINNEIDVKHRKNIDSFYELYQNDWQIIEWTNQNIRNVFCGKNNKNKQKCQLLSNVTLSKQFDVALSIKSDILRFMIMYIFGGMYFDTDFIALQNMNDIISIHINTHGLIVCNEVEHPSPLMSNGFFVAYPNNKFVANANTNSMIAVKYNELDAWARTGPYYWKRIIYWTYYNDSLFLEREMLRRGKRKKLNYLLKAFDMQMILTELPTNSMYSLPIKQQNSEQLINEIIESKQSGVYAIHLWDASWKKSI